MRTATEVIDQAISENRKPEWLLYCFATAFVITGEIVIGWALYTKVTVAVIAGFALNGLAWPAFRETKLLRAENLMLRMLEVPLSKTHTAEEAAKMLTDAFARQFRNRTAEVAKVTKAQQGTR